jgi:6-phosphogluconolactonase (cycloisomerase 2 family)
MLGCWLVELEKGAGMNSGKWAKVLLLAAPLLVGFVTGCGNFWQAPPSTTGSTSFSLSNSGALGIAAGATTGNTATITVTPANSFTGSVTLTCAVTTNVSSPVSEPTCSLSPTSVSITDTTAQTSTLTATTTSTTTAGAYQFTVTGNSGGVSETTSVCVTVGSASGSCSSANGNSGVFYVLNQTTNQIAALNLASGQLNTIGTTDLSAGEALAIAVAPNGDFLYVSTVSGIYLYEIGSDGALTEGNGGAAITPDPAFTMQVDSTNSWLVEAVSGTSVVNAINVIPTGSNAGMLATTAEKEQQFTLPASTVTQLAISPGDSSSCNDCYVFVGMGSGGTELINFNPGSVDPFGNGGTIKLLTSAGGDNAVAVDPHNRLLYVGETNALPSASQTGGLRVFTIASNGVTPVSGSPYAIGGTGPSSILPTADGSYVYVANQAVSNSSASNIAGFSVTSTALTSIGTVAAGNSGRIGLAEDSTSSYILAVDFSGNPDLEAYTMSAGTLTSVLSVATGTDPVGAIAIAAAP